MNAKIAKTEIVKHLPQILSVISCAGVGAVAYLSGRNTLKAKQILDEKRAQLGTEIVEIEGNSVEIPVKLGAKETLKTVWKYYIPTAVAMGLTGGAMIASRKISAAQLASMTAAAGYFAMNAAEQKKILAGKFEEINAKLPEDEKISELDAEKKAAAKAALKTNNVPENTGDGEDLCIDAYSGRRFYSNRDAVIEGLEKFQSYCADHEWVCYNDLFGFLNLTGTYFGDQFGWHFLITPEEREDGWGTEPEAIEFDYDYIDVDGVKAFVFRLNNDYGYPESNWMDMC